MNRDFLASSEFAAVLLLDANGRVTRASTAARHLWQAEDAELDGQPFSSLFCFDVVSDGPGWLEAQWEVILQTTLGRGANLTAETRHGNQCEVRVFIETFSDNAYLATVQRVIATVESTNHDPSSKLLFNYGAVGFFELNLATGRATYSPAWKKMLGYESTDLPDTIETWKELIHPDDSAAAPDSVGKKHTVGPRPFSVEFRMRHLSGEWIWIQCVGVQILSVSGQLERVVGLHLDISERKELEETSFASDERMGLLSTTGPLGVFDLDFVNQRFWFSPSWKKILGYRESELADELDTLAAALPPDELPGGIDTWLLLRAPGQSTFVEPEELVGKDGVRVSVLFGAHRTLNRKRDLARVVGFICAAPGARPPTAAPSENTAADITRDALAALSEGVLVVNLFGRILHCNPAAARLLGLPIDQIVDQPVAEIFRLMNAETGLPCDDPCDRALSADQPLPLFIDDALLPAIAGAEPRSIAWTARAALDADGKPRSVAIVFRDPAEMNLTPEELVKANRFESLGLLAGGIAHDFNNILTVILGSISLAREGHDPAVLENSEKACLTAKNLTKHLLMFAKGGSGTQSVVSIQDLLEDAVRISSAGSDAEIAMEVPEGVEPVRVDRAQMVQVFQNLVLNAVQSMPPPPHRARVQLSAKNTTLTANQIPPLAAGNYVEIEVRDNASGIAAENLQKIFDPFFTTRKHGTGLGLSTVLSIVRKHGGQIGVDSTIGAGTAFTVFLPRADAPVEVEARKAPSLRFGTGRILFMDDDPRITAVTATMLQNLEYKYDIAKNGDEVIQLYKRYLNIGRPYDAVIMDITVVGGMGAEECFKILRDMDPEVRAIMSSGYENEQMARRVIDMGFCGYLTKPYRVTDLGKVLKAVLA